MTGYTKKRRIVEKNEKGLQEPQSALQYHPTALSWCVST